MQAVQLVELGEAAIGGLVGGERVAFEPAVAAVTVEVVAGIDRLVDERWIEDAQVLRFVSGSGRRLRTDGMHGDGKKRCKKKGFGELEG